MAASGQPTRWRAASLALMVATVVALAMALHAARVLQALQRHHHQSPHGHNQATVSSTRRRMRKARRGRLRLRLSLAINAGLWLELLLLLLVSSIYRDAVATGADPLETSGPRLRVVWIVCTAQHCCASLGVTFVLAGTVRARRCVVFSLGQDPSRYLRGMVDALRFIAVAVHCSVALVGVALAPPLALALQVNMLVVSPLGLFAVFAFLRYHWPLRKLKAHLASPKHAAQLEGSLREGRRTSVSTALFVAASLAGVTVADKSAEAFAAILCVALVFLMPMSTLVAGRLMRRARREARVAADTGAPSSVASWSSAQVSKKHRVYSDLDEPPPK